MRSFFIVLGTVAALFAVVPLMVWAGSGSWRHALHALKQYLSILAVLAALGGGLGLLTIISDHGFGGVWDAIRGR